VFLMLFGFAAWFGAFLALGQLDADRLDGNSPAQMMAGAICLAIVGATFIVCASLSRDDD
jgi:hypothetical protein